MRSSIIIWNEENAPYKQTKKHTQVNENTIRKKQKWVKSSNFLQTASHDAGNTVHCYKVTLRAPGWYKCWEFSPTSHCVRWQRPSSSASIAFVVHPDTREMQISLNSNLAKQPLSNWKFQYESKITCLQMKKCLQTASSNNFTSNWSN